MCVHLKGKGCLELTSRKRLHMGLWPFLSCVSDTLLKSGRITITVCHFSFLENIGTALIYFSVRILCLCLVHNHILKKANIFQGSWDDTLS